MIIDNAGTYTLKYTATDECGNSTTVDRELVVEAPVYGIISRSATSTVCERIGASALFTDPVPQHSDGNGGWVGGSSPFDNCMPWSGMGIVEDATAGTLVKIPKYWYKWTRNGDEMQLEISSNAQDGFYVSPAHADRGDGVGERDFVYVGRYHCATGYKSQSGIEPLSNQTIVEFRSGIHGLGSDVWQYDFAMYWTIAMLYLVEFANWDSQKMIGGGCSGTNYKQAMGLTDSMTYHTGTTNTNVGNSYYGQIQYRHIEGLWSNVWDWCEGIYFNNENVYAINNPAQFGNTEVGINIGTRSTTTNMYPRTFNDPSSINGFEYALYPNYGLTMSDSSRTKDYCMYYRGEAILCVGGSYTQDSNAGLFYYDGTRATNTKTQWMGSRLMKLPA